jgi:hypothetical protein
MDRSRLRRCAGMKLADLNSDTWIADQECRIGISGKTISLIY